MGRARRRAFGQVHAEEHVGFLAAAVEKAAVAHAGADAVREQEDGQGQDEAPARLLRGTASARRPRTRLRPRGPCPFRVLFAIDPPAPPPGPAPVRDRMVAEKPGAGNPDREGGAARRPSELRGGSPGYFGNGGSPDAFGGVPRNVQEELMK